MRVPKAGRQKVISGYFDDLEKLAEAAAQIEAQRFPGIYWTLNPVNRALLARSANKTKPFAADTTKDSDILARNWLPVDFDPVRPTGISSTEDEHAAALQLAERVRADLLLEGWPEPIFADSGNGSHLLYPIELPNDAESAELLRRILQALASRYNTAAVEVDRTTFNASRIFKTYGTFARKGDNTADRPHRVSHILQLPALLNRVPPELLHKLAAQAPPDSNPRPSRVAPGRRGPVQFDLEQFLNRHGISYRAPVPHEGGRKFVLEACPFNPDHKAPDSAVFENAAGRLGFKCFHDHCQGYDWQKFRDLFEPRRLQQQAPIPPFPPEPPESDASDEIPLSAADVEAAIDALIEKADLPAAIRMAPDVAKLAAVDQAVIKAKLKKGFKDFPTADFNALLKAESDDSGQKPPEGDPPTGDVPDGPDLRFQPLTDAGNGERIVALYGKDIRYCIEMKRWLVWDGKRWAVDEVNEMRQKGKHMARLLYLQALDAPENRRVALERHARASESYAAISNALGQAATEQGIPVSVSDLDQLGMLLNVPNGVLDLSTGKLLPHNREFMITKLCPVPYDPKAKAPRFQAFIEWAMGGNADAELTDKTVRLVGFVQRALGSSLTGDVSDRSLFVFHGGGKNGKSTLLTLFRDLLGKDYSSQLIIDTLMSMKNQDSTARADVADLRGARFVMTSEVEKEHKLSEGKLKMLTAGVGAPIKAKRLYENPYEFPPTHKIFMDCNDRPKVRGTDNGIWDRLKLVPFDVRIAEDEKDKQLPDKLRAELPGVLAWAVRGCLAWKEQGLGDPPEVAEAGQLWREHDDPLKEFLDDCCKIDDAAEGITGLFIRTSDLAAGYEWWAKQNRERYPLGKEAFTERLHSKGFTQSRSRRIDGKQSRTWEGIELLPEVTAAIRKRDVSFWQSDET